MTTLLSLLLVAGVGFFAHRASVCMVRSVAEIFSTGQAFMLLSFVKALAWVTALGLPLTWLLGPPDFPLPVFSFHSAVIVGGFVFGVGAAINGGCSISTVTRFGDGDLGMVWALLGLTAGAFSVVAAASASGLALAEPLSTQPLMIDPAPWTMALLIPLWAWALIEVVRMWRRKPAQSSAWQLLLADRTSLSGAAALIGISAAILCVLQGAWMYAAALCDFADALVFSREPPRGTLFLFLVALVLGAVLSGLLRGSFRFRWPHARTAARHTLGGVLMGAGAAVIPGGNAALLLHGVSVLSPHAIPGLMAMMIGIAVAFYLARAIGWTVPRVDCSGDVCRLS